MCEYGGSINIAIFDGGNYRDCAAQPANLNLFAPALPNALPFFNLWMMGIAAPNVVSRCESGGGVGGEPPPQSSALPLGIP
jgi:hypothetical protein